MSFSFSKVNGILSFHDFGGWETRNSSTFWCIQEADKVYKWPDFSSLKIHTGDYEAEYNNYTYSKQNNYNRLVPDFNFHSWPQVGIDDYELFVKQIDASGRNNYEIHKVGWIGNTNTHFRRKQLLDMSICDKELLDIFDCGNWWINPDTVRLNSRVYISTPDLVKRYSILIDIEGGGYSGRLKHLLWSHRPVLLVDRPHKEFFFKDLREWEHYIPVRRDLLDLIEKAKWCINNYDKACEIAEKAYEFSKKYLTRESCYTEWDTIIRNHIHSI
jgi:hypothetical protein